MYDFLYGKCPKCDREVWVETKLLDNTMDTYKLGDSVGLKDMNVQLKLICQCFRVLVAKFQGGKYMGFTTEEPTHKEMPWGSLEDLQCDPEQKKQLEKK